MHGADLEEKMSSKNSIKSARELAEKWGLQFHMEIHDRTNEIVFSIKNTLYSSTSLDTVVEWINEEFEEK